ncbi:helix-turn-helix domain-containing protein [Roseibium sp. TrichSKD4]|uniref:helix-turn-helix domain-containing protein n=1 Tax=Roseibium sp. TrichSKD4 TaxID=744980 RepID=UPI0005904E83|nr:helix-turn-helix transcriptional regulator [Roseibium sp. TrichSKD4]
MIKEEAGWRDRLRDAVRTDGRPLYRLSEEMGRANTYVSQVLKNEKTPSVENLIQLCNVLNVDPAYILSGVTLSKKGQRISDRWQKLRPMDRDMIEELLIRLSVDSIQHDDADNDDTK